MQAGSIGVTMQEEEEENNSLIFKKEWEGNKIP
jgi:hypothetical protein